MLVENFEFREENRLEEVISSNLERKETLKRLFVGFNNKQKLEHLRFFVI